MEVEQPLNGVEYDYLNYDTSLLTFNYTRPSVIVDNEAGISLFDIKNIHGDRKKSEEIIFGIDALEVPKDLNIFTKSYRRLNLPNEQFIIDGVKQIFFYGHGLGEADYSYFMAMFDYYDLYDSKLKLDFCYSEHDKKTPEECREEETDKIVNLISKYGESLDNSHGNSLMYKLQLEGRIEIVEIKTQTEGEKTAYIEENPIFQ